MARPGLPQVAGPVLLVPPPGPAGVVLAAVLHAAGHQVHFVDDAVAFAEAFAAGGHRLAVVALDPGFTDGGRLLTSLRARFPMLPLVLVGDPATPGAARLALELGAVDLLPADLAGVADLAAALGRREAAVEVVDTDELLALRREVARLREDAAVVAAAATGAQVPGSAQELAERRDLERYAAEVAHDMHGPLRTVRLLGERLQDRLSRSPDPEALALVDRIHQAVGALQELVDGVLADARGQVDPTVVFTSNADRVLDEVVALLEGTIRQTGGVVTRGPLAEVAVPPHQLRQILQNLVANALHHGGDPPEVHVTARRDGGHWVLSVRDNGPGIPPERREDIFRPLTRLESGRLGGGHGLGLSICRKLVERAGGKVSVHDAPGGGSVFRVSLPGDPALDDEPTLLDAGRHEAR